MIATYYSVGVWPYVGLGLLIVGLVIDFVRTTGRTARNNHVTPHTLANRAVRRVVGAEPKPAHPSLPEARRSGRSDPSDRHPRRPWYTPMEHAR
jgi:hypothetical protein